ncbi:MAG: FMN-binding negative transcriptional regulator [Allosphingosinicella sp.]|uniref:FMN-binding negative transcriptional regulator n=1 Tax=Allosphingosinicella sp. TaxID=2823234 RepID=UPI00392C13E7
MHPNRVFHWTDEQEMLAFVAQVSFATICVDGPAVVHAPLVLAGRDRLLFHVSRSNPAAAKLENARAIASVMGPDFYVSPDWYGTPDQVPTWNYLVVEAEGPLRPLDEVELAALLDRLSADHEERLTPKMPWTRGKMTPGRFEAMLKAIIGYELTIEALRGTRKLGQNKKAEERESVADALAALGRDDHAALMQPSPAGGRGLGEGNGLSAGSKPVQPACTSRPHPSPLSRAGEGA